jgi:serine/threonine-protein phosphatase 5
MDANQAIEMDPYYVKGYYRRGSAYLALMHLGEAVKDFAKVEN